MGYEVTALALYTVAVGVRTPQRNSALVNVGPYGSQEPMTMYAGSDGTHRHGRQRPPEEGYLACHRQGRPDPGGLPQTEHPLPLKMGGHSPLEQEDGGGPAGDGLQTWEEHPPHHNPPNVQDPGGGVPGVGWALEGITAATRG
ncbi:hypothetical protein NDU88_002188 [Pleurodeles waltl]|uniref:Uncharacterized protein n=1 Tax=Pleurodeles waltl TaxID=8319 RepID=A0AAV7Q595_PLEWA|nr:hypothetical protein NDU88_002188 [Pleurodeles waltl]